MRSFVKKMMFLLSLSMLTATNGVLAHSQLTNFQMISTQNGTIFHVWLESLDDKIFIKSSSSRDGINWDTSLNVSDPKLCAENVVVISDDLDNLTALWTTTFPNSQTMCLVSAHLPVGGSQWSEPTLISNLNEQIKPGYDLFLTPAGSVVAAWCSIQILPGGSGVRDLFRTASSEIPGKWNPTITLNEP